MTRLVLGLDEVLTAHLRRSVMDHRRWCRANGVPFPVGLDELVAVLADQGGLGRPQFDLFGDDSDSGHMVLALEYAETAARLHVSERTVRRLVAAGALPAVDIGGCKRVRTSDLAAYVEGLPITNAEE